MILLVDQQIIFGPDNRSTGSITTWAFEKIPRELCLTCNTGPNRIMAKIKIDGGPVGLGYGVTSVVKCRRVVVTLTVAVTRIVLHLRCRDKDRVILLVP